MHKQKRTYFKCGNVGHIARNRKNAKADHEKNDGSRTAMIMVHESFIAEENRAKPAGLILDSGCTRHLCNRKVRFTTFSRYESHIQIGNNETMKANGWGTIKVISSVDGLTKYIILQNVLQVLEFA